MNLDQIKTINKLFLELFQIDQEAIPKDQYFYPDKSLTPDEFITRLVNLGKSSGLLYLSHCLSRDEVLELLEGTVPFLAFIQQDDATKPIVIRKEGRQINLYEQENNEPDTLDIHNFTERLLKDDQNRYYITT